jgi:ornithine carbamoyltransferase
MNVRICAPELLWPSTEVRDIAQNLAKISGARLTVTDDVAAAVEGVDFVYTDVWVSMGEPTEAWTARVEELVPYQVNRAVMDMTKNPAARFMHCLPALHNRDTEIGSMVYEKFHLSALEVTDEVFESPASIVFDQAENRLHTIKAVMVATLGQYDARPE